MQRLDSFAQLESTIMSLLSPLLRDLHWLRAPERIAYRLAVLAFRCQHGLAPSAAAVCIHNGTDSAQNAALDNRRPRVSCRGCTCVEQSTAGCYAVAIITDLQEETENRTLFALLLRRLISHLLIAAAFFAYSLFCFVTLQFLGTKRRR